MRACCQFSIGPDTGACSKSAAAREHSRGVLPDWRIRCLLWTFSSEAIARARATQSDLKQVEFRVGNIMDYNLREEEPWDLIVMSETVYFLGWLYSFFDVSWVAAEMFEATRPGGQMLLANTQFETGEPLLRPCIIRTYRDLFLNVGYELNAEKILPGVKHGVSLEVLMTLFRKVDPTARATS